MKEGIMASLPASYYPTGSRSRRRTHTFTVFGACLMLLILCHFWLLSSHPRLDELLDSQLQATNNNYGAQQGRRPKSKSSSSENTRNGLNKHLVVASVKSDDVSWITEHLPDWQPYVYVANDRNATLRPPANKGHEAMMYLTYMIDNYDDPPDVMAFIHSLRYQWHNDDPMYDGVPMLRRFNTSLVAQEGYVNLRCTHILGCPAELRPAYGQPGGDDRSQTELALKTEFKELFPNETIPEVIAASCCAQFAISAEQLRKRPLSDYVRFRDWLLMTSLNDAISGRIFEYTWHIIFGRPSVHCPSAKECYCKTFGLCDLDCDYGTCKGRYVQPPFINMPPDWPNNPQPGWGIHDDVK